MRTSETGLDVHDKTSIEEAPLEEYRRVTFETVSLTNGPPKATETLLEMAHSVRQECQVPAKTDGGSLSQGHAEMTSPLQTVDLEKTAESTPTSSQSLLTDDEYPEGGIRAYSVVFGSFCGLLVALGLMNTEGTLQAYLSTHQLANYSESSIAWIFGLYIFLSFFCGVQIGPVFDAKGPRWLIFSGSICLVGGILGMAESTKFWHFILTFSLLGGIGTSLIFTPAISAIGHFFLINRGSATGLASTSGSVGGIIFPLLLPKLFSTIGFAWAIRVMGLIFLVLVVIANLLIKSRLPPKAGASMWPDFRIFKNEIFALTAIGVFFIEWGLFIPLTYISSYALHYGISPTFSYQLLAVLNAGSFFGRWLPGYFADRFGRFNLLILTVCLSLIMTLVVWLPARGNLPAMCFFAVCFGFTSGSNISLTPVCIGQLCQTEEYGRYYATAYTIVSLSCLTGVPIAGQLLAVDGGDYRGLILFTGMCYLGGLICIIAARVLKVGWSLSIVF